MASQTPIILIVSRDPEVKAVSSTLTADGLSARFVSSTRELQRALVSTKGRCVAVFDAALADDASFDASEILEKLRGLPLLMLLLPDGDAASLVDGQRT